MQKGFKVRIYPTKSQEKLLFEHINSCRFIWNYMLNLQNENHEKGNKYISEFEMNKSLTPLKKEEEYSWLNNCSNSSYQIICRDLNKSFQQFFKTNKGYPKFKSKKKSKLSFPTASNKFYFIDENRVQIQKIGKVKYKTDFQFNFGNNVEKFSNVRITYTPDKKWIISFSMNVENQDIQLKNDYSIGIDLGVKDTMIIAYDGNCKKFSNINKSKKVRQIKKDIQHIQKSISRKYEQNKVGNKFIKTNNIIKEEEKLRRLNYKLSNIRDNYLYQSISEIIKLNPIRIVMEDLNISGMMKNRHLSKAIQEQKFFRYITTIRYKCEWNNIEFIQVNRFFPSSKLCSNCGVINSSLKLSDRTFICPSCGHTVDRDYQAALNLSNYNV